MLSIEVHGRNVAPQICRNVYKMQTLSHQTLPDEGHSDKEDDSLVEPVWCRFLQNIRPGFVCEMI